MIVGIEEEINWELSNTCPGCGCENVTLTELTTISGQVKNLLARSTLKGSATLLRYECDYGRRFVHLDVGDGSKIQSLRISEVEEVAV